MEATKKTFSPKKVLFIVLNVFFYVIIFLLLLFSIANIRAKSVDDIPNVFGIGFLSVQSDSMNGSNPDSFNKGDLIFVKIVSDKDIEKLEVGDVISFYDMELKDFNTHRIVETGDDYFVTQGDLAASDPATRYQPGQQNDPNTYELISKNQVKSVYLSKWKGAGKPYDFIVKNFLWMIVLPVALLVILEVVLLVRNILRMNEEKMKEKYAKASIEELDEETKERLRKELLEELKKEQAQKEEA